MLWRRQLRLVGRAALAASFLAALPCEAEEYWLCISSPRPDREVLRLPTGPEGAFSLSFIHSVSKTLVTDIYRIVDGEFLQIAEVFEAHGAGLPSFANDMDATGWRHVDGHFILDLRRATGPIRMRIQAEFRNTLHTPDTDLSLATLDLPALILAPCPKEIRP